ncbi:MAG: sigma-54 dependent transcriptional regulator [Bauldia sp.]
MAVAAGQEPVSVLIVDQDPAQRRLIADYLRGKSRAFSPVAFDKAGIELMAARAGGRSIVIADIETVGGASRLGDLSDEGGPVIAVSAKGSVNTAVAAMRAGAADFVAKPFGAQALLERVEAAVAAWAPRRHVASGATPTYRPDTDFEGFVGTAPLMRAVYAQIERLASSRAPVFITGESGTGKELCAEAIHARGGGAGRPLIAINCSAIPRDLIESELFGHVRGAFTGATENRAGAAELADGGTLFLDEIGEMDLGLQSKLLRFVQTGMVRPVGGSETRRVEVRLVSATNRDPASEVRAGRLREDLYYRLNVLPVRLPALRDRVEDILPLARAFLARFAREEGRALARFEAEAEQALTAYAWPGNVRQLENAIRRIVVLYDGERVTKAMLPPDILAGDGGALPLAGPAPGFAGPGGGRSGGLGGIGSGIGGAMGGGAMGSAAGGAAIGGGAIVPFWKQEQAIIETALAAFGGNTQRAAAALEISPSTIYRKRQAWAEGRTG